MAGALLAAALVCASGSVLAAGGGAIVTADPSEHFDPKGKPPSTYTIELQKGLRASLPFEDERDFEEAKKGFLAAPPYKRIESEAPATRPQLRAFTTTPGRASV